MPAEPQATLHKILELLGFPATVEDHRMEEGILLDVKTDDSGRLIGRQGQTLADLQYITNRILFQQDPSVPKVLVDVGGYRAQAREALVKKAKESFTRRSKTTPALRPIVSRSKAPTRRRSCSARSTDAAKTAGVSPSDPG